MLFRSYTQKEKVDLENKELINHILHSRNFIDYKWVVPRKEIVIAQWVRFRCQFGCNEYGKAGSCPPAVPSIEECRNMIFEYNNAIILHFIMKSTKQDEKINLMSALLELEREIFLEGYYKSFLLQYADCVFCKICAAGGTREKCVNKIKCRPSIDAMGIDMFQTARNAGYEIQVLKEYNDVQNRFAILLIE